MSACTIIQQRWSNVIVRQALTATRTCHSLQMSKMTTRPLFVRCKFNKHKSVTTPCRFLQTSPTRGPSDSGVGSLRQVLYGKTSPLSKEIMYNSLSAAPLSTLSGYPVHAAPSKSTFPVWTIPVAECEQQTAIVDPSRDQQLNVQLRLNKPHRHRHWLRRQWRRFWRVCRMIRRAIKLTITLSPIVFLYPFVYFFAGDDAKAIAASQQAQPDGLRADAHDVVLAHDPALIAQHFEQNWILARYLRICLRCVEISGASVIKLMQWAGSRPDLFGHEFCAVFCLLQDHTTPHSWNHTKRILEECYGEDWHEKIELYDILGSGCIGQVYRGKVLVNGTKRSKRNATSVTEKKEWQEVAVKILHPNVENDIDEDLDLMRVTVRAANYLPLGFLFGDTLKWLNLEGIVEEFSDLLKMQLDLRQEASNLERFNENFKDEPNVVFPRLVEGYQPHKHLLVETFCKGIPVLKFARENAHEKELLHNMCRTAIRAVCQMIFLDNFVHADLHPGNVFVDPESKKFVVLDVGIVAEYTEADHLTIVNVLAAFIRTQGRKAGRLMIDDSNSRLRNKESGDKALDEERFIDKIEELTIQARSKDYLMEYLGTYISYICNAAAQHHVMMNSSFISAALAVKVQEGIALALDPSIEIWKVATPIILESERRRRVANFKQYVKDFVKDLFGNQTTTTNSSSFRLNQ